MTTTSAELLASLKWNVKSQLAIRLLWSKGTLLQCLIILENGIPITLPEKNDSLSPAWASWNFQWFPKKSINTAAGRIGEKFTAWDSMSNLGTSQQNYYNWALNRDLNTDRDFPTNHSLLCEIT